MDGCLRGLAEIVQGFGGAIVAGKVPGNMIAVSGCGLASGVKLG